MNIAGSKRGRGGAKRLSMPEIRAAFADRSLWTGIGLVFKPGDASAHWEKDDDIGILVHVELVPNGEPLMARLGGLGSGGSYGVWRIPPIGSEVALLLHGDLDDEAIIVGILSSGGVPAELDADTLVVKSPKIVIIADGAVEIGDDGLLPADELVHGSGIDPFTGATYKVLTNTASTVKAKK